MKETCTGHNRQGKRCGKPPVPGAKVCRLHGGAIPVVAARAIVRAEVAKWGLTDEAVDPGLTLLALVTQSSHRAALYASLLEEQYAKAEAGDETTTLPQRVGVLIGRKFALNKEGRPVPVEEAIRALVDLEGIERDRCARFCEIAIRAGLAERTVRLAESQGSLIADVLRSVLADPALGLSDAQRIAVPAIIRSHLAIEGTLE